MEDYKELKDDKKTDDKAGGDFGFICNNKRIIALLIIALLITS